MRISILLCWVLLVGNVWAQPPRPPVKPTDSIHAETRSQRWLPLPEEAYSRNADWLEQLSSRGATTNPFERDQSTTTPRSSSRSANNRKPSSKNLPDDQSDSSASQMAPEANAMQVEQLRKLLKQFGEQFKDQLPSDSFLPNLDGISNETLGKALADPSIREQAQRWVEQYRNESFPGPDRQQLSPPDSPKAGSNEKAQRPTAEEARSSQSKNQSMPGKPAVGSPESSLAPSTAPQPKVQPPKTPRTSPPSPSEQPNKIEDSKRSGARSTLSDPALEQPEKPKAANNASPSNNALPSANRSPSNSTIPSNNTLPPNNTSNGESSAPLDLIRSFQELSKQVERLDSKEKQPRTTGAEYRSGERSQNEPSKNTDIKRKLDEMGLDGTLNELVQRARQEALQIEKDKRAQRDASRSSSSSSKNNDVTKPAADSGWADGIASAIDRASKSPSNSPPSNKKQSQSKGPSVDSSNSSNSVARDASSSLNPEITKAPNTNSTTRAPGPRPSPPPSNGSWFQSTTDKMSDFAKYMNSPANARTPRASAPTASNSTAGGNKSMEWGAPSSFWILMLLLAFAVLGGFLFWVRQQNSEPKELVTPSFGGTDLIQSTTSIRTRADVVRAFHQLAVQIAYPIEFWWTANRVASRVDTSSPGVSSALQVAVSVYEQSRYLPDNAELTEEQLVSVRDAIHVLGSHAKGEFLGNAKGNDRTR